MKRSDFICVLLFVILTILYHFGRSYTICLILSEDITNIVQKLPVCRKRLQKGIQ